MKQQPLRGPGAVPSTSDSPNSAIKPKAPNYQASSNNNNSSSSGSGDNNYNNNNGNANHHIENNTNNNNHDTNVAATNAITIS